MLLRLSIPVGEKQNGFSVRLSSLHVVSNLKNLHSTLVFYHRISENVKRSFILNIH